MTSRASQVKSLRSLAADALALKSNDTPVLDVLNENTSDCDNTSKSVAVLSTTFRNANTQLMNANRTYSTIAKMALKGSLFGLQMVCSFLPILPAGLQSSHPESDTLTQETSFLYHPTSTPKSTRPVLTAPPHRTPQPGSTAFPTTTAISPQPPHPPSSAVQPIWPSP